MFLEFCFLMFLRNAGVRSSIIWDFFSLQADSLFRVQLLPSVVVRWLPLKLAFLGWIPGLKQCRLAGLRGMKEQSTTFEMQVFLDSLTSLQKQECRSERLYTLWSSLGDISVVAFLARFTVLDFSPSKLAEDSAMVCFAVVLRWSGLSKAVFSGLNWNCPPRKGVGASSNCAWKLMRSSGSISSMDSSWISFSNQKRTSSGRQASTACSSFLRLPKLNCSFSLKCGVSEPARLASFSSSSSWLLSSMKLKSLRSLSTIPLFFLLRSSCLSSKDSTMFFFTEDLSSSCLCSSSFSRSFSKYSPQTISRWVTDRNSPCSQSRKSSPIFRQLRSKQSSRFSSAAFCSGAVLQLPAPSTSMACSTQRKKRRKQLRRCSLSWRISNAVWKDSAAKLSCCSAIKAKKSAAAVFMWKELQEEGEPLMPLRLTAGEKRLHLMAQSSDWSATTLPRYRLWYRIDRIATVNTLSVEFGSLSGKELIVPASETTFLMSSWVDSDARGMSAMEPADCETEGRRSRR